MRLPSSRKQLSEVGINPNHDLLDGIRFPNATLPTLMELYSKGASLASISSLTSLPRERIRIMLHAAGVQMRRSLPIYHAPNMELNYDSAMLLGLHAGDGYLSDAWGPAVCNKDKMMGERIITLVRDVLGVEPGIDYRKGQLLHRKVGQTASLRFLRALWVQKRKKGDNCKRTNFGGGERRCPSDNWVSEWRLQR
jgi:hypothetical protein